MALMKVSEVAEKAGFSPEEALKMFQDAGVNVSNINDMVSDRGRQASDATCAGLSGCSISCSVIN